MSDSPIKKLLNNTTPAFGSQEVSKVAEEGGLLAAFYQEAKKIAAEVGVDEDDAIRMANEAMGTKVATHTMIGEINRIHQAREIEANYSPGLAKAASYAPVLGGPYAGILRSLRNRQQ